MWAHSRNIYKLCPYSLIMVYHEIRKKGNVLYNYIIHNIRNGKKWNKKSKFIGKGKLTEGKIEEEIKKFKLSMYKYFSKEDYDRVEQIKNKFYFYLKKGGKSGENN